MMYLDRSSKKFKTVGMIFLSFTLIVYVSFAVVSANADRIRRGENALARARADFTYWTFFKVSEQGKVALAAAGLARASESFAPQAGGTAKSIPVLLYHGEGANSDMPWATFVAHLNALHDAGWRTVSMADFEAFMNGTATLPDKSFLLSFDDGRKDTFYHADPVLKDLGFRAVMFVITGLSLPNNGPDSVNGFYLTKSELAYMQESGRWDLESHGDQDHRSYAVPASSTSTAVMIPDEHFLSNKFPAEDGARVETAAEYRTRITNDLSLSKQLIEEDFGTKVRGYAYPFNDFGQESVNYPGAQAALADIVPSLYRFAFYQTWPGNGDSFNHPGANAYFIKRIEPTHDWSSEELLAVLEGGRAKPLPYSSVSFGADWGANWGIVVPGASLTLSAASSTTGAAAFLDGTESWRNYRLKTTAKVSMGTLSLIARHTETDEPYLVCAFSDDHIYLERHSGTKQTTLATARYAPPALPALRTAVMTVRGTYVSCGSYGVSVEANVPGIAREGGIGASIWDPEPGTADAAITNISATGL